MKSSNQAVQTSDAGVRPSAVTGGMGVSPNVTGNESVLVIDDDLDLRSTIKSILDGAGYSTRTAPNGAVALDLLRTWTPRLIFLDLTMPVMNGSEFRRVQLAYAALASVPTVVMTARADAGALALTLPAEAHMPKPFQLDRLLALVSRYCG
jgi:CheY-like chemotaxis protein